MTTTLETITTEQQAKEWGIAIARNEAGTGWMAALDSIVDEAMEECGITTWPAENHETLMERLQSYAEGWTETDQYDHEVRSRFATDLEGEDRMWHLVSLNDAWVEGYIEVLLGKIVEKLNAG